LTSWTQQLQSLRRSRELLLWESISHKNWCSPAAPIFAEITWTSLGESISHKNWCSAPNSFNLCKDHVDSYHKTLCWSWTIAKIDILSLVTSIFVEITWITITTNYVSHEQQLCHKNWHLELSSFNLCGDHVNYYYEKVFLTKIDVLQWLQSLWRSRELQSRQRCSWTWSYQSSTTSSILVQFQSEFAFLDFSYNLVS